MSIESQIAAVEIWAGCPLPPAYVDFLARIGGEFFRDCVLIYSADSIIERNETFQTKVYCPGYLAIGDDSGGRAIVIPLDAANSTVFSVDHGSMAPEEFEVVGESLQKWVADECPA
ncbi:MAG: SMI1/KNR4 family protein [Pseudomonadota bacterium]